MMAPRQVVQYTFPISASIWYSVVAQGEDFILSAMLADTHADSSDYSAVGKETAIVFRCPDSAKVCRVRVRNLTADSSLVVVRLIRKTNKYFAPPFRSADAITYYNMFGYRPLIGKEKRKAVNGHDGVDISVATGYSGGGKAAAWLKDKPPVMAMADGVVLRVMSDNCRLGTMVWIKHETPAGTYTALYGHLEGTTVAKGDSVRSGATVGHVLPARLCPGGFERHLHLEMWKGIVTSWDGGYSNGRSGQINPLGVIFSE